MVVRDRIELSTFRLFRRSVIDLGACV